jgi:hypothetical protein
MSSAQELADLLERTVREEHAHLAAVVDGPATKRPNRPSGAGWSQREELGHLVDSAAYNYQRFFLAPLAKSFAGPGYDADAVVAAHRWGEWRWPDLVRAWHDQNAPLVPLVRRIPDESLATPCAIGDDPPVTLGFLIEDYVVHLRHHVDQILWRRPVTKYPRD